MNKKIIKHFTDLGLKEEDAQIYLNCMKKPQGLFVHELVQQTSIKRSTIDLILDRLRKKGFISRHKEGARWVYCAEPPERIAFSFEEKLENFQNILPALINTMSNNEAPMVRFFECVNGLEYTFDDILLTCGMLPASEKELLIISSGRDLIKALPNHEKNFIKKRIKKGISTRILAPRNKITEYLYKDKKEALRQTAFFDDNKFPFNVEIDIYGDKVAMINLQEPNITASIIQSSAIATSMRSLFMMLWAVNRG